MHFFNPAHKMNLVEIVRGEKTSKETIKTIKALAESIGKTPVEVNDRPGFIVNRLLIPMINEAAILLEENIADRDSIDTAMKLGAGHPMGPLALADLIGIDICLHIMENLEKQLHNSKYSACKILKQMVKEHKLGRKTKEGFYKYER
ncbi:MAG: 3-hydroxyacyl-CoA dehydrogenase family protein [Candidatus Omnitrophica bacterium]|nr:3-hydroxyacyl-CoA dehydrogenase family protein [Candidatus Omnitrophota bacterium]